MLTSQRPKRSKRLPASHKPHLTQSRLDQYSTDSHNLVCYVLHRVDAASKQLTSDLPCRQRIGRGSRYGICKYVCKLEIRFVACDEEFMMMMTGSVTMIILLSGQRLMLDWSKLYGQMRVTACERLGASNLSAVRHGGNQVQLSASLNPDRVSSRSFKV